MDAIRSLKVPQRHPVSRWADENRILDSSVSSRPGRWKTATTPYLQEIMDAFTDPEVEEIVVVKAAQTGGTEAVLNMIGSLVDEDPGPALSVMPNEDLRDVFAETRIKSMIRSCPSLAEKYDPKSSRTELRFRGMTLSAVEAGSAANLASRPCRYVFLDEVDKYPARAGKEADPVSLAKERTKTYPQNKKIVELSTPTFESGKIWEDYQLCETKLEYFVTCPHCGKAFVFSMRGLKWDGETDEEIRRSAVYACEECGGLILDSQKNDLVRGGCWKPVAEGSRRRLGFRFSCFLSPDIRLGDIAAEYVLSQKSPERMQNFVNSWLGEPYREVEGSLTAELLLEKRQGPYSAGVVPPGTVLLTGGVDVQRNRFYWTIRAWLADMTSYNVCHGEAFSWAEITQAMNRPYPAVDGSTRLVNLCAIDSGDQTDEVYLYCLSNQEWAIPVKGSSQRGGGRFRVSRIDKAGLAGGLDLVLVNTVSYKDMIYARATSDEEYSAGWYLHTNCDPEYAEMVAAEEKVIRRVRGKLVSSWEPKRSGADNHYLDCEVYAAVAADLCGLRDIYAAAAAGQKQ